MRNFCDVSSLNRLLGVERRMMAKVLEGWCFRCQPWGSCATAGALPLAITILVNHFARNLQLSSVESLIIIQYCTGPYMLYPSIRPLAKMRLWYFRFRLQAMHHIRHLYYLQLPSTLHPSRSHIKRRSHRHRNSTEYLEILESTIILPLQSTSNWIASETSKSDT